VALWGGGPGLADGTGWCVVGGVGAACEMEWIPPGEVGTVVHAEAVHGGVRRRWGSGEG